MDWPDLRSASMQMASIVVWSSMDTTTLLPSKSRTNTKVGRISLAGTGAVVKDEGMVRFMDRGGGEEGVPASKSMATLGPFGSPTVTQCVRVIEEYIFEVRSEGLKGPSVLLSFKSLVSIT